MDSVLSSDNKLFYGYPTNIPVTTSTHNFTCTTTQTTTVTTVTTESIYKNIMFLGVYNSDYSLEDINGLIIKYSGYCNLSYDTCVSILSDNHDCIPNYSSFEEGIMRTLFEKASDMGLLNSYCPGNAVVREMDRDQKEAIMLDMCNVMGISNDDKKIILSIFRWETGHGNSYLCASCNNYGGIRVYNGEFGIYQTPEYGMYRAILYMYDHICRARNNGCSDIYSVISYMSSAYCPGTASAWTSSISGMISGLESYYSFEDNYVKKI